MLKIDLKKFPLEIRELMVWEFLEKLKIKIDMFCIQNNYKHNSSWTHHFLETDSNTKLSVSVDGNYTHTLKFTDDNDHLFLYQVVEPRCLENVYIKIQSHRDTELTSVFGLVFIFTFLYAVIVFFTRSDPSYSQGNVFAAISAATVIFCGVTTIYIFYACTEWLSQKNKKQLRVVNERLVTHHFSPNCISRATNPASYFIQRFFISMLFVFLLLCLFVLCDNYPALRKDRGQFGPVIGFIIFWLLITTTILAFYLRKVIMYDTMYVRYKTKKLLSMLFCFYALSAVLAVVFIYALKYGVVLLTITFGGMLYLCMGSILMIHCNMIEDISDIDIYTIANSYVDSYD